MRTEKLNSTLLSTLLVTSLMVPLLTMALASVPYAQSYPPADNDHMDPTTATIGLTIIGIGNETLSVTGPTTVERGNQYDPGDGHETIDTEIISMTLTGISILVGPITIVESPTKSSSGSIKQQYAGYDFPADSFFDVFIEIQTGLGTLHNDDPVPMETTIYAIPPLGATYQSAPLNIPLKDNQDNIVGFITHVSHSIPPVYLDNLRDLWYPVSSQLHELFPNYSRQYHLTSWIDTNGDFVLSSSDKIDTTDENGKVTWWHVDAVTITMLVENLDNPEQIMYIELDPWLFHDWEFIKNNPLFTPWHEIWPVFSRWYLLTSWFDENFDKVLGPSDIIDLTDEFERVTYWHVADVKYDIIIQLIPPPEEFIKENMPDLGQHSVNWCWTGAAANSIKWYAHHGYPELLDDLSDNVLDDNYTQILPWLGPPPCPSGGFPRLLHEIAIDGLYPGVPENEIPPDNTFCKPIGNDNFFYGLQEFIDEQGADLYVHEIVDNSYFGGVGIPPEDGENVIYAPPTFDNYKKELERCQDVLLQLAFRNYSNENYSEEQLDHIVTGVSFFDAGPGAQWIGVSDPWTPHPGPDHNNLQDTYTYDNLQVVSEDPLIVVYTGEVPRGTIQVQVQVVKLIYISPAVPEIPWTGTVTISLLNLYTVNVEKILDLNQGSKLVVKFYTYSDAFENESVFEDFAPPAHIVKFESVGHPENIAVKKVRLDLTTDNTENVILTIASFIVRKVTLEIRFTEIPMEWLLAPTPAEKVALEIEFSEIPMQWALAPS